ncbi:MAG: methionine--tRNA ligase [Bacteroidota bacterium]|nr:methionine--tRNA ligase [Bacteroidota bacterium]
MQNKKNMSYPQRYTVTTALPYANGPIHIGHLAGVYIPADIYVRYLRLNNKEVIFIGGSDEHGVPISLKARTDGKNPQQIVDKYHQMIEKSFKEFGISFDIYSRTSSKIHHKTASEFFKKLYDKGIFVEKTEKQLYDEKEKMFLADRYVIGSCPKCGFEEAYGDQCEKCGSALSPRELKNPKSKLSGNQPVLKETKHWYLPLKDFEAWLKEWIIEGKKGKWRSNVYGQCSSWINDGLRSRAVTRDLNWGVPVPIENAEGKVIYVWFDAPIGYISATKELTKDWEKWWKDKDTKLLHFIGKDNIVFHCIIFPAMLKAEGSYILPDNVPANEFMNLEGEKISTSKNWAVWLHEYLKDFPEKQDVLRYVLTSNAPEAKDSDFIWKDFKTRNNNELVALLGNFINRVVVLTEKYFDGKVPETQNTNDLKDINIEGIKAKVSKALENYKFREGLSEMMNLARAGNKYLAETEPWKLIKTDKEKVGTILNNCIQISANVAILMNPFLPFTSEKIMNIFNMNSDVLDWDNIGKTDLIKAGKKLNKAKLLFEKLDDKVIDKQYQKLKASLQQNKKMEEKKEEISFDDFIKMDIKVAEIIEAEKVPKTDKLLKLKLDLGSEQKTVVSGIAHIYEAQEIIGKRVSYLQNLKPRKIRGIESSGMILMVQEKDGNLIFLSPEKDAELGASVG